MRMGLALAGCVLAYGVGAPARAGSVNDAGFTTGTPVYADFPQGLYAGAFPQYGTRQGDPKSELGIYSLFFYYQTGQKLFGGTIGLAAAPIFVTEHSKGTKGEGGFYNTYAGVQLTWALPHDWGVGVRVSSFLPQGGKLAYHFGTMEFRTGVTYLTARTDFTANLIYGHPVQTDAAIAPDYANLDLTYTKKIGKWELGAVGFGSIDSSRPYEDYQKQAQFALGPLIGFDTGRLKVQVKLTSDIAERNYGGKDRRVWANITFPFFVHNVSKSVPITNKP